MNDLDKKLPIILTGMIASIMILASTVSAAAYIVQPGDYLWKIAVEHGITVDKLKQMNRLTSNNLYPNQVIQVPDEKNTYISKAEDTLWKISQQFGVPLRKLIAANPQITNPNVIWNGLKIRIPEKPDKFLEGVFPLGSKWTQPFINNFAESRAWSPTGAEIRSHEGVDIFAKKGTPIYSALQGKIMNIGWNQYGGWRITIKVNSTTAFYYAHLSKYADGMKLGANIAKGQIIGYVGNTGYGSTGTEGNFLPHLHFGIYHTANSPWKAVNPYSYLKWWQLN